MANKNAQKIPDNFQKKNSGRMVVNRSAPRSRNCEGVGDEPGDSAVERVGVEQGARSSRKPRIDRRTVDKYWERY